jgi:hypothetical protein
MDLDQGLILASVVRCPGGPEQGEEQLRRLALSLRVSTSGRACAVAKRCAQKIQQMQIADMLGAARGWR